MNTLRKIKDDIYYIGASDMRLALFENLFPIEHGVSYNSYCILDEKTCVLDTADSSVSEEYFKNLSIALNGRNLDYLVIHHLEPDHSACIAEVLHRYQNVTLVLNDKIHTMLKKFIDEPVSYKELIVKENDVLKLGKHQLAFVMAPMVHWPEVMVSYDLTDKILFSADAFGTFGALTGNIFNDEITIDPAFYAEARRYYTNIVGKFGVPVQGLLKKASALDIQTICPLHGPIWRNNFEELIHKYDLWSKYEAEDDDVVILYGSMYNNTYHACCVLANILADKGIQNIKMYDVSKTDVSYLIAEIFRVKTIVLACPTYNGGLYPKMHNLLADMLALNVSKKNIAIIENGSWAPTAGKKMKEILTPLKEITYIEPMVTVETMVKENSYEQLQILGDAILKNRL